MKTIADWLTQIGMHEYTQRFAENAIDLDILTDLTDQDLEKIGVKSLGHRRKLLRAIANFKAAEKATPAPAVAPPVPRAADTAERRQVTVMFSDLVGSTALAARMDPEDLRELISAYHKCVAETVRRFSCFVAKYLGDGVLVYFGYPKAHEDDAARAVRAGLEVIVPLGAIKTPALLQTRVGIATGLVVVGDLTGLGEGRESGIIGETPNLAARLQGIAEPNSVVIAEATRRLLGNLFELRDLGTRELKGLAKPVRAWLALRESTVESRFEALHPSGLALLVGREGRQRSGGADFRRTGHRQIPAHRRPSGSCWSRTAYPLALLLFAPAHRQRVLSDHRSNGTCCWILIQRYAPAETRQARCSARGDFDPDRRRRAHCGDAFATERWPLPRTRTDATAAPAKNHGGAHHTD